MELNPHIPKPEPEPPKEEEKKEEEKEEKKDNKEEEKKEEEKEKVKRHFVKTLKTGLSCEPRNLLAADNSDNSLKPN